MDVLELVKENAQPIKGGRDAAALARALGAAAAPPSAAQAQAAQAARREREQRRAAFEARVAALSAEDEDPLREWREYAAWVQAAYPSGAGAGAGAAAGAGGTPLLVDVLERCTRSIKADARLFARYRNDAEYVKVWVAYVSSCMSAGATRRDEARRDETSHDCRGATLLTATRAPTCKEAAC